MLAESHLTIYVMVMAEWLAERFPALADSWWGATLVFLLTNATAVIGLVLALLIIHRIFNERRSPSNFFAWLLIIIFAPLIGVPLYLLFGGRKSRKIARIKRQVANEARALIGSNHAPETHRRERFAYDSSMSPTNGNQFELLPDGESGFHRLCDEIKKAKHTIHIATYILGKDEPGLTVVSLLERRAQEGIKVRLLLDSLGCWSTTRSSRRRIRAAGGEVAMFMPVLPIQPHGSANLRNHRKLAIFDNSLAISGGQNIDNRFIGPHPHPDRFVDFNVVTQGPAVAHLTRTFLSDWAFASKQAPSEFRDALRYIPKQSGDSTIKVVVSGPDVQSDPLWEQILRIIQEFKQNLTIITPYFIPDEVLFHSLIVKAHTGRQIRLIMPLRSNHPVTDIARYHYLRPLNAAGVEILFYTPRMLHGKLILADDKVALVGSANVDMRSLFVNFEIALVHYSSSDIAALTQWSNAIIEDCIPYAEAIKDKNVMPSRFLQRLVHLTAPLL